MLSLRLTLRALRWRLAASVTVFAVALVGIVAAAVGPIYLHAVDSAVLASRLVDAPQNKLDVRIVQATTIGLPDVDWHKATHTLAAQMYDPQLFDAPVFSANAPIEWTDHYQYDSDLAAVGGLCAHVKTIAGRCVRPSDQNPEADVTSRIAQMHHISVGDTIATVPGGNSAKFRVRIVGIVTPIDPHGTYWAPWPYLNTATSAFTNAPPRTDAFFVGAALLDKHFADIGQTISANLNLRASKARLDDLDGLRAKFAAVQSAAAHMSGTSIPATTSVPVVHSGLIAVIDTIQKEMSLARTLVILPAAQLVVLAVVLLYAVVAGTASASGHEVALAKLRGRRTRSVLTQGLAQPIVLVLLAAPIAAAIAWGVVRLVAPRLLGRHIPVVFPISALWVVIAATAASVLAAAIAARRILVAPVGQLLRRGESSAAPTIGLVLADAATVALGAAGVVELVTTGTLDSGSSNPLSAVATVLLGAAIAVLVVRLLPLLGRVVIRWTSESSRLAGFLAVRQIVRRPLGTRVIVLLGVALSLASFAVVMSESAANNRDLRALGQAGAHTAYYVRTKAEVYDLREAVDRADPGGHSTAAAIVRVARTTPVLAVDTTRFAGVGAWTSDDSPTPLPTILKRLRDVAPSIVLTHRAVRFEVRALSLPANATAAVTVTTTGADHLDRTLELGPLHQGSNVFRRRLDCTLPCRVTGIAPHAKADSGAKLAKGASIGVTVSATASGRAVPGFADPANWQQAGSGTVQLGASGGGLQVQSRQDSGWPTVSSADSPSALPALVSKETASLYNATTVHDVAAFGLDSAPLSLNGEHRALSLPTLDRNGAMVDFGVALNAMRGQFSPQTQLIVYASSAAPADLADRLKAQGVTVTRTVHASDYADELAHTGPAFADGLFLVAAVLGALLALGATVLASATAARRRAYEVIALRTAGAGQRMLRRAVAVEQAVLLGTGLIVGFAAGLIGARLALPNTPVFADEHIGLPVDTSVPFKAALILAGVLIVVFALTSLAIARVASRQATAERLREAAA